MKTNEKVEYLKQFLTEGQVSMLNRMYPTGEYTARTIDQMEKTLSDQAKRVEDLQNRVKELETAPPLVVKEEIKKEKKIFTVEANFDYRAKFFTSYEIEAESEEEVEEIAEKYIEIELTNHPFSEIEREKGEFIVEEKTK